MCSIRQQLYHEQIFTKISTECTFKENIHASFHVQIHRLKIFQTHGGASNSAWVLQTRVHLVELHIFEILRVCINVKLFRFTIEINHAPLLSTVIFPSEIIYVIHVTVYFTTRGSFLFDLQFNDRGGAESIKPRIIKIL